MKLTIIVEDAEQFVEDWQGARAIVQALEVVQTGMAKDTLSVELRKQAVKLIEQITAIEE